MILNDIITQVRAEAKVKGSAAFTGFIIVTWNRIAKEYAQRRKFPELFSPGTVLSPVGLGPTYTTYNLPVETLHVDKDSVRFTEDGDVTLSYPLLWSTRRIGVATGFPNRVMQIGQTLVTFPYESVTADSRLIVDVWVAPTVLAAPQDEFNVPTIESTVLREVIAYVSRHTDSDVSDKYIRDAARVYAGTWAVDPIN